MLITSALPISADLLENLTFYKLDPAFTTELKQLEKVWHERRNDTNRLPHLSLASALTGVTRQPIRIVRIANETFVITTRPLNIRLLRAAVREWERHVRAEQPGLPDTNALSPFIDQHTTPTSAPTNELAWRTAADNLDVHNAALHVLRWTVTERLTTKPLILDDGMAVNLRIDTGGSLLSWDQPLSADKGGKTQRGMLRITPRIQTLPGHDTLVCTIDASLSRLQDTFHSVRNVWINHAGSSNDNTALLHLPVRSQYAASKGVWTTNLLNYAAEIVEACSLERIPWGEDVLRTDPDLVRAGRATNDIEQTLGTGVGPRTFRYATEHACDVLGVDPISYRSTSRRVLQNKARPEKSTSKSRVDRSRLTPEHLDKAIDGYGFDRLRIVHLSGRSSLRERVRSELSHYQDPEMPELSPEVGRLQQITNRAEYVAHDASGVLTYNASNPETLTRVAPCLEASAGTLVVALVDTEYEPSSIKTRRKSRTKKPSGHPDAGTEAPKAPVSPDTKRDLRRSLARLGISTQFLAYPPYENEYDNNPPQKAASTPEDYRVHAALKDLIMRTAGLTDDRLTNSINAPWGQGLDREAWLVGVHVRRQNRKPGKKNQNECPLVVHTLVALRPHLQSDDPWSCWYYQPDQGWLPHANGIAQFHAGPIGLPIPQTDADIQDPGDDGTESLYRRIRDTTDKAIHELRMRDDLPVIVMLDATECRRIWKGIANNHLGDGLLPGNTIPAVADVTVVRVNADMREVPRPIHRDDDSHGDDPHQPAPPGNTLWALTTNKGRCSWLLGRTSRTYNAGVDGRIGERRTRHTLPEERKHLQQKPWHSYTATEFMVPRSGVFDEEIVACTAARLCAQPISWDAHTTWPVPLHMARAADLDHPDYRSNESTSNPRSADSHEEAENEGRPTFSQGS